MTNLSKSCVRNGTDEVLGAFKGAVAKLPSAGETFDIHFLDAGCDEKGAAVAANGAIVKGAEFVFIWLTNDGQRFYARETLQEEQIPFIEFSSNNIERSRKAASAALEVWYALRSEGSSTIDSKELEDAFFEKMQAGGE